MKTVQSKDGVLLGVHVKPRSGKFKVLVEGDDVVVYCCEEPQGGRVNKELVKELSRFFHKKVEFVSGFTSRDKEVLVRDAIKDEIERVLSRQ